MKTTALAISTLIVLLSGAAPFAQSPTGCRPSPPDYGADAYIRSEGYQLDAVSVVQVDGRTAVVAGRLAPSFTTDLPLLFPSFMFRNGLHYVKPNSLGGITDLVNDDGQVVHFSTFTAWKPLR